MTDPRPDSKRKRPLIAGVLLGAVATVAAVVGLGLLTDSGAAASAAPQNTSPPTISGTVQVGQKLHADPGSWDGAQPMTFAYQWQRCNQNGTACANIGGATGSDYTLGSADVGNTVRVVVTASNSSGSGTAASSPTAVVAAPAAPANSHPPYISGTTQVGQTLTLNPGAWTGSGQITFAFQWRRCDQFGDNCADISGATQQTYLLTTADLGHTLRGEVKASNSNGTTLAVSAPSAVIVSSVNGCPPGTQPVPVTSVTPPARLTIDRSQFAPPVIGRTTTNVTARFHVSDTCGQAVQGALVYATAVPYNQLSSAPEATTDPTGWATITFTTRAGFPAARYQQLLVFFVRARKPGENLLTGISTRRLISVRVNLNQ
jgi:hypothetical protein